MDSKYNQVCERLWEKMEFYRDKLNFDTIDLGEPFPWDQFVAANPELAKKLGNEVQDELNYQMSEFQGSWAVFMALKRSDMQKYNQANGTSLRPRA